MRTTLCCWFIVVVSGSGSRFERRASFARSRRLNTTFAQRGVAQRGGSHGSHMSLPRAVPVSNLKNASDEEHGVVVATPMTPVFLPPQRIRRIAFALTYLGYCTVYLIRKPISVVKPELRRDLGVSAAQLGVVDTSWLAFYALGQLSLGHISQLMRPSTIVGLSFAFAGCLTAACSAVQGPFALASLWGLNGFCQAALNPLLVLFLGELYPSSQRGAVIGAWQTSMQVGGVGANFFAAEMLLRHGWRSIFLLAGTIAACFAAPMYALMFKVENAKAAVVPVVVKHVETTKDNNDKTVPKVACVRCVCCAYFLVKMCRYSLMFWLPYFLTEAAKIPTARAAKIASLIDVGGVMGSVLVGQAADKVFGGASFLAVAPFALLTSVVLVAHANLYTGGIAVNGALMLLAGFAVAGPDCVLGGAAPMSLCEYSGVDVKHAASISGLVNGVGSIGAIVQGYGTAKLVDYLGWQGFFYALAAAMALATAFLIPVYELERKHLKVVNDRTTS